MMRFKIGVLFLLLWSVGAFASAPDVLARKDLSLYNDVFMCHKKNHFISAKSAEKKISDDLLMGYVLFDRYFSKQYKTSKNEISAWMKDYSDLPVAVDMYALGNQKKVKSLKKPKGLFGSNTQACVAPSRQEPIDLLVGLDFSYLSKAKRKMAQKKMNQVARYLKKEYITKARSVLEEKEFISLLKQEDLDKARTAVAFSYVLYDMDEEALAVIQKGLKYSRGEVPLALWVAGLVNWRMENFQAAAEYFSELSDLIGAPEALRVKASYWAARAYLSVGDYDKVSAYLKRAAAYPRYFYGMLALRALGRDLNYVWDTPSLPSDEVTGTFSHPALERFYALRQLGRDDWASQELSKLYLEADDEAKSMLMMISEQNGFADSLQSLTGTLQGEATRYPMPDWEPERDGWQLDKALVYAFVRQESCFNNRAESHAGALGLMQLMPDTARDVASNLQCTFSKQSLKKTSYNLRLGQAYLGQLLSYPQVSDNLMFVAVAYNAGPGNLAKWKERMRYNEDPLLFLEIIPSKETRGFAERILVNYWVYRNLMNQPLDSLDAVVHGKWPMYAHE